MAGNLLWGWDWLLLQLNKLIASHKIFQDRELETVTKLEKLELNFLLI